MRVLLGVAIALVALVAPLCAKPGSTPPTVPLPLRFEPNRGQASPDIRFIARGNGYHLHLRSNSVTLVHGERRPVSLRVIGARRRPPIEAKEPLAGLSHYFIGPDPARWRTNVRHYGRVIYRQIYPGVDWVVYGNERRLEYDFIVQPGADPRSIRFVFDGIDGLRLESGDLVLETATGLIRQRKPIAYQRTLQGKREVAAEYAIEHGRVSFRLGEYDRRVPLVIDPTIVYSTYIGGSARESVDAVAADSAGNTYVAGATYSSDFPVSSGAVQTNRGSGRFVAYLVKVSADGRQLLYSTFLSGSGFSIGRGIAVDASGNAYLIGTTEARTGFPTTPGALQAADGAGFLAKLSPNGDRLVYSAVVPTAVSDVAVDAAGFAYIAGTARDEWQTTPDAFQVRHGGGTCQEPPPGQQSFPCLDAFVAKVSQDGSRFVYSTYLGGNHNETGMAVAVDESGNAYVVGETLSDNFPASSGALQPNFRGRVTLGSVTFGDGFVAKLNPSGTALVYATYLGGNSADGAFAVALDRTGNAYVVGGTQSADFPASAGALQPAYGGSPVLPGAAGDGFVTKLGPTGTMVYSTFLGGSSMESVLDVVADAEGNAYVTGNTQSPDFPLTPNPLPRCRAVGPYVSVLNSSGTRLLHSTVIPTAALDGTFALDRDRRGGVYVAGTTRSTGFFATPGAAQSEPGGDVDAFVLKLDLAAPTTQRIGCIVNAASLLPGPGGAVAPGEIISIFGTGVGPETPLEAEMSPPGPISSTLGGTRVLFDGIAAPLLYAGPEQINAVVPLEVQGRDVRVVLERAGQEVASLVLPSREAAPGVFTLDRTGVGQAAALNEDGTVNSPANPALRGSVVALWATGFGRMEPPISDGTIAPLTLPLPAPRLTVGVTLLWEAAQVVYAGAAPGMIAGAVQVNFRIPDFAPSGSSVPVTIKIGETSSQAVTLAIR